MSYPLATPLTPAEANRLAEVLAFTRQRAPSGRAFFALFQTAADRQQAELLIARWRSER